MINATTMKLQKKSIHLPNRFPAEKTHSTKVKCVFYLQRFFEGTLQKDTFHKREHTAVLKQKPRTRLARRGSRLVRVTGLEPAAS